MDNNFKSFKMDLDQFGSQGYNLNERADFSGHPRFKGNVSPHINVDIIRPNGNKVIRDLVNEQMPGFNNMIIK